jgi:catechol 1,2-dioxygenase
VPSNSEGDLTRRVIEQLDSAPDDRLRTIMKALVEHLHAFASEVRLTDPEWMAGIEFLTATGQMCSATRQEFILLSDTLGLSSLVQDITHGDGGEISESTVLGPFYRPDAPFREFGASLVDKDIPGELTVVTGQVRSEDGAPLPRSEIDVWQAAPNGLYDIQDPEQPAYNLRGRFRADEQGTYRFITTRPPDYPVQDDGPVGRLLLATGRHPWRAAHIHAIVTAQGHAPVTTHIFDSASPYLDSDTVFGVKDSLIRNFVPAESTNGAGSALEIRHDFVLRRVNNEATNINPQSQHIPTEVSVQ